MQSSLVPRMRRVAVSLGVAACALAALPAFAAANTPVAHAAFTTTNSTENGGPDDPGHCKNGNELVNCNIYDGKQWVWMNGGPAAAQLDDGDYFFAVLVPGGQGGNDAPNDGTPLNLSDPPGGDDWTNRQFSIVGGAVVYNGSHDFENNKIRLLPYDDTTNPGGVYILAICSLADADGSADNPPGVDPSDCKYDAFKVNEGDVPPAGDLEVSKDANPSLDRTYTWHITKDVDKTLVQQVGGSATFNYTVNVSHDAGTDSNWQVTGTIHVFNPNLFAVSDVDVTDEVDDGGTCVVTDGTDQSVPGLGTLDLDYTCTYASEPDPLAGTNTATATWPEGILEHNTGSGTAAFDFAAAGVSEIDECVDVTDTYAGSLGEVCVLDPNPTTLSYSRVIAIPQSDCVSYDNTATFTTTDTGATRSDSETVTVCGPHKTGALTMGFWKGPNGNNLIKYYCAPAGKTSLGQYLSGLGTGAGPFAGAPAGCDDLVTYVNAIFKAASATDMNKMLKAQMLATALDVYFSTSTLGYSTVASGSGKNQIKPPSNFLPNGGIGTFNMDTTAICPMVDNLSTGTALCKNATPSTDANAAGAVPAAAMTVNAILAFAATPGSSPWTTGAFTNPTWYGTDRTKQEILKNIFDQINNNLAFGA